MALLIIHCIQHECSETLDRALAKQDGRALLELHRQACTAPFYASEKLSPSIRCPTRPVRFPLPLLAAVGPLGVVFCWLSLQARVRLRLTIYELRLCEGERALMMSDSPAAENTPARPLHTAPGSALSELHSVAGH